MSTLLHVRAILKRLASGGECTTVSRDYAKVASSFWTGKTGRALRGDPSAQIVGMYLITCQHANMIGVFNCPPMFVAHETGLPVSEVLKAINRLSQLNFCEYDASEELIWVREMAKYQICDQLQPNDKRVPFIHKEFAKIPECRIKKEFHRRYQPAYFIPDYQPEVTPSGPDPQEVVPETSPFEAPSKPLPCPFEAPSKPKAGTEAKAVTNTPPTPPRGGEADFDPSVSRPRAVDVPDPAFEAMKALYPQREGGQNWRQAFRAWRSRLREGMTVETLLAGTRAYADYVRRMGKEGTPYVKQAATFFSKDQHFLEAWEGPLAAREDGTLRVGRVIR